MCISVNICSTIGQFVIQCDYLFYHWSVCHTVWLSVLPLVSLSYIGKISVLGYVNELHPVYTHISLLKIMCEYLLQFILFFTNPWNFNAIICLQFDKPVNILYKKMKSYTFIGLYWQRCLCVGQFETPVLEKNEPIYTRWV